MKIANAYWTDNRLAAQNIARRESVFAISVPAIAPSHAAHERTAANAKPLSPVSSMLFAVGLLALLVACFTVTLRTQAQMNDAAAQHALATHEAEQLRNTNTALRHRIEQLRTNPRVIETAARTQLGMVRADEIIVPVR